MEDVNGSIVRTSTHQRVVAMELHFSNGLLVITQSLVRSRRQVQVKPGQSAVIRSHDNIIAGRVNIHRRHPFHARLQLVHQGLLDQVVDLDLGLGGHKEVRVGCRTELAALDDSLEFGDGDLGGALAQLVDVENGGGGVAGVHTDVVTPRSEMW